MAPQWLAQGTSGQILRSRDSAQTPEWINQSTLSVGTANNIAGGTAQALLYQTGSGSTTSLPAGTSGQILSSRGTALSPQWINPTIRSFTPATSGTTGNAGEITYDTSFIYVCVATNTWRRTALSTF
jgi:hypothetical protein